MIKNSTVNYSNPPSTPPRRPKVSKLNLGDSPSSKIEGATESRIINMIGDQSYFFDEILRSIGSSPLIISPNTCDSNNVARLIEWMMKALMPSQATQTFDEVWQVLHYLKIILNYKIAAEYFINIEAHIMLCFLFKSNTEFQKPILDVWWQLVEKLDQKFIGFWREIDKNRLTENAKQMFLTLDGYFYLNSIYDVYAYPNPLKKGEFIASGNFGCVSKVFLDSSEFVLKEPKVKSDGYPAGFFNEVKIHSTLMHKNIVKLRGFSLNLERLSCLIDFEMDGTLHQAIQDNKITTSLAISFACGIANGLGYMHSLDIMHGDIKPKNILLSGNTAKLADFGSAVNLNETVKCDILSTATDGYFLPGEPLFALARDIFAFSIVWKEMLGEPVRKKLFSDALEKENTNSNIKKITDIPKNIARLMSSCGAEIFTRPTAKEVVQGFETFCQFQ